MPDTGWLLVGSGTEGGTGSAWQNPHLITGATDFNEAVYNVGGGPASNELRGTNIGAAIPSGNTPVGVEVRVEVRSAIAATITEVALYNGGLLGTAKTPAQSVASTRTAYDFGGATDTWGATLTEAIVEGSGFGAYIKCASGAGSGTVRVDTMWIKIHYATAATPVESDRSLGYAIRATVTSDREIEYAIDELGVALSDREILYEVESNIVPPPVFAPPRPAQPTFSLAFYTPVGSGLSRRRTDLVAIDPSVTAMSWTTQLEGFGQLSVGLDNRHEPGQPMRYMYPAELPTDLPPFAEVQLTDGGSGAVLWEGRVEDFSRVRGIISGFTATGYGLAATRDAYIADDDDTETTTGAILLAGLRRIPALRPANAPDFVDPQIATTYRTLGPLMVADLVSQVVSTGDAFGRQVDFSVWEGRVASLRGRSRPPLPHYRVDEDETVQVDVSYANVYSAVNVAFQTGTSGEASLVAGNTSVTVTHGLEVTPRADQITVNPIGGEPRVGGTATITSGNTFVTVNHGLDFTPEAMQITVTPTNDLGATREFASGSGTVISGNPDVTINHGLSATPESVRLMPTSTLFIYEVIASRGATSFVVARTGSGNAPFNWEAEINTEAATKWWIANITSSSFDIAIDQDPGANGATFDWSIPTTWGIDSITSTTFDIAVDASANTLSTTFEYTVNIDNATTGEAGVVIADLPRRALLIPGGTLNYELAIGYRDAMLKMLSRPEYRVTLNRHVSDWITGPRGEPIPPWLVRAGQWIQVGDLPMQIILRTSYDPFSETFSLEAGSPQRDLGTLLSSMQRTVERLAAARNANTGAKL